MKTCKDCYHYDVCGKKPPEDTVFSAEQYCPNVFKDKSLVIDLPFPPGGDVYFIDEGVILKLTIAVMHIGFVSDDDTYYELIDTETDEGYWDFKNSDIGKTVFRTKEAAEQALKEREQG